MMFRLLVVLVTILSATAATAGDPALVGLPKDRTATLLKEDGDLAAAYLIGYPQNVCTSNQFIDIIAKNPNYFKQSKRKPFFDLMESSQQITIQRICPKAKKFFFSARVGNMAAEPVYGVTSERTQNWKLVTRFDPDYRAPAQAQAATTQQPRPSANTAQAPYTDFFGDTDRGREMGHEVGYYEEGLGHLFNASNADNPFLAGAGVIGNIMGTADKHSKQRVARCKGGSQAACEALENSRRNASRPVPQPAGEERPSFGDVLLEEKIISDTIEENPL